MATGRKSRHPLMPIKTSSDLLIDAATRHTVYLLRYSTAIYNRQLKLIDEAIAEMIAKLNQRDTLTPQRMQGVLESLTESSKAMYSGIQEAVQGDLRELADYESGFVIRSINAAFPIEMKLTTVSGAQIYAAAMAQPFQGRILKDWFKDQEYGIRQAFKSAVKLGFIEGESISQISARVRGVGDLSSRQVESVIRTAVNHTAQVARNETTKANAEIFAEEEWVATLDGRTTAVCRGRDGERYPIGKGPQPPAHFGCRSHRVPITKSWKELGLAELTPDDKLNSRPYVADKRKLRELSQKERDQLIGQTTAKSYNDWLKTQPRHFVEDVLGVKKAKLFLDGGLTLDKFIDRQGAEYTLKELAREEAKAFAKAGIDKG